MKIWHRVLCSTENWGSRQHPNENQSAHDEDIAKGSCDWQEECVRTGAIKNVSPSPAEARGAPEAHSYAYGINVRCEVVGNGVTIAGWDLDGVQKK